jgi:prepilin-type N-terminal cleavage/methylation domain-containing protein
VTSRPLRDRRRLPAGEDGFSLIELMVAITVLAVGMVALVSSFDHSRELVTVSEKTEVASHRAERELERILAMTYENVGHASTPAGSTDPSSPASRVNGTNYQYDQDSTPQSEPLAVVSGAGVGVAPEPWNDGESRLNGQTQSFITWTGSYCTSADRDLCAKRVTVAVTVGGPEPLSRPVLISTIMTDPTPG